MLKYLAVLFLMISSPALAQTLDPSSAEYKLKMLIGELIWNSNIQGQQIEVLTKQLATAQAELKALKEKPEKQ